jgi:hypothetical protein
LSDDAAPATSHSESNGNFLAPRQVAREQHARQIETGHKQHDHGQRAQHESEHGQAAFIGGIRPRVQAGQGSDEEGLILLFNRQGPFEIGSDRQDGSPGCGGGDTGLEASDNKKNIGVAPFERALGLGGGTVGQQVVIPQGEIELRPKDHHRSAEILGRYADHREGAFVHADGLAHKLRVEGGVLPVEITDDDDGDSTSGHLFLGEEGAAPCEWHFERPEVIRTDEINERASGGFAFADADHSAIVSQHPGEEGFCRALFADVCVGGIGKRAENSGMFPVLRVNLNDLRLVREGPRAEEKIVNNSEDGRIGSDTNRERQHRHGGEARRFGQRANRETQIAGEVLEEGTEMYGANFFFHLLDAAEFNERLPPGRRGREPLFHLLLGQQFH